MYKNTLTIGMKIDIEIINELDESKKLVYPSQILDILKSEELLIRGPIKNAELVFLHKGDKINISYNVLNKGKHYFKAEVLDRSQSNIYTLNIKRMSKIMNLQNREYYRLSSTIYVIKEFKTDKSEEDILVEECETKDISGGGIRLYSNYKHKTGDYIICSFKILNELISVKCKVTRIEEIDSFNYKYTLGLSFLDIPENHRDTIIRYIFDQQRKLRLKGLM